MEAARKILQWMQNAGLSARIDAIGNVRGILASEKKEARTLVIASHIDTVVDAGRWDGPLGVLMGLDLLENRIRLEQPLPFHVELIAFCDEEGVRFQTTYLGSKVVAGNFDPAVLERIDDQGVSLATAIREIGGDPARLADEAIPPGNWLGYFEIHIEQGPVLYEKKIPVAAVQAIAGQVRAQASFTGVAGHAGTVPMPLRADALCGAAEFVLGLESLAMGAEGRLVATVGRLQILNAAGNVIPGEVSCSVDIRSADAATLTGAYEQTRTLCKEIGARRDLRTDWHVLLRSPSVPCDPAMSQLLHRSIRDAGYEALSLVSGAGHDAVPISAVSPVCMLFVRCFKGISHNPLENVERDDLAAAIRVADNFINQLAAINGKT